MSEQQDSGAPIAPTTSGVDARVTALEAKVDAHQGSLTNRFGILAGIAGFVISMFTIFDRVVTQPNNEKVSEYQQLKSDIRSIASAYEELAEKSSGGKADSAQGAAGATATITQSYRDDAAHMLTLLGSATRDRKSRFFIGPYDFVVLSDAAYGGGNTQQALEFNDRAVAAADTPYARAEALKLKAWMLFQVKGAAALPEAREALKTGYDGLTGETSAGVPTERAQLFAVRAEIEAGAGACADAAASAARAVEIVSGPDALPAARPFVLGPLAGMLKMQTRCPYSQYPESLRDSFEGGGAPAQTAAAAEPAAGAYGAPASPQPGPAASEAAPIPPGYSLTCRLLAGPRAGQVQSYVGVAGAHPVPIGSACNDGVASVGVAQ